ncbi:MAG: CDP-diacylglycerol--glycerol-3-phosphate 3-phosphatidyltransferase [Verrucomicrobia bacterium]|nr:CDP-diacylglycerol--glycerol-3-phosphate 3-phosphatidyltransferase [Verrucomicrobiota bacterium]
MTLANKITILRILILPFFIIEVLHYRASGDEINRLLAILAFAAAAITDGVDGYIARRYNQRSELGAVLDPLADKLLLVSGLILLSLNSHGHFDELPDWLLATVLGRDAIILVGVGVIHFTCGKTVVQPRISGKVATVFQMVTIVWALLKWDSAALYHLCLAAAVFTGVSGVYYVADGIRQLSASPSSTPTPKG